MCYHSLDRHAAFSERRVRSDQRKTENTLSRNRQSQLESEYVIDFKDGARVDAIDVMTARAWRLRGTRSESKDLYLKCCRFACFIFEVQLVYKYFLTPYPLPNIALKETIFAIVFSSWKQKRKLRA